ncbi:rhodanese-like domain-containing protein [Desulfopila sp. IMCC35008]|uniref:rhodanese-like domain-containing protein n=1 Tax=Desulfopila sp. IMCC35008 TaxID=2653858 RepID=UPI0013D2F27E|nr:rhodanese-like domain-containing protein [Desulfopila sp. IMCC35008]
MNILSLFQSTDNISSEQVRLLIKETPAEDIQLVDVRQPSEYKQEHIPGAILIPLKELPQRKHELNRLIKTIVYCRSGVRSKAGCQILREKGFKDVLNMTGGITRWQGHKAAGSEIGGFEYFVPGDFESGCIMAWVMEKALQQFYLLLAEKATESATRELLEFMAHLEDGHMSKLAAQYKQIHSAEIEPIDVVEGGIRTEDFLSSFDGRIGSTEEILHIGMMFEAQAYDLYSRLERKEREPELRRFYQKMAEEEQTHLERLTNELEKHII